MGRHLLPACPASQRGAGGPAASLLEIAGLPMICERSDLSQGVPPEGFRLLCEDRRRGESGVPRRKMGPREDRGSAGQCLAVSGHQLRLSRVRPDVPRASSCVTPWGQLHRGQDQVRRAGVSAGGHGDSGPGRGGPPHQTQAGGRKPDADGSGCGHRPRLGWLSAEANLCPLQTAEGRKPLPLPAGPGLRLRPNFSFYHCLL